MLVSAIINTSASGMQAQQVRQSMPTAGVAMRIEPVKMPENSAINLPGEIMELVKTQIASKADLAVFETGAEFWDMLMVATDTQQTDYSDAE